MAQERKKRRIVLASILKPVDDTRMFEKMGASLALQDEYEVFITGFPIQSPPSYDRIRFIPLRDFHRLSFQRLLAKWKVFGKCWKIRPDILIFTTHELILPAILLKIFFGTHIVYDVRENYYRNILHAKTFPWFIRWPLALMVRFQEKLTAPMIDHYFLAEAGYDKEFRFHRGGWTVLENKVLSSGRTVRTPDPSGKIRLLFTGTLSESTGVFRAIQLAKGLNALDPRVTLDIVGYAAQKSTADSIKEAASASPFIRLTGIDNLVHHKEIIDAIKTADAGIIAYPLSDHTRNSRPTKLFEYLGSALPIILESHWPWINEYQSCQPFILADFSNPDYSSLLTALKTGGWYLEMPQNVSWATEEAKLKQSLLDLV